MLHFPAMLTALSWVIAIIDAGVMLLFFVGAATYKPGRLNRQGGMRTCLLIGSVFGSNAVARALDGYMGGAVLYATASDNPMWPLVTLTIARAVHIIVGFWFWAFVLLQFRKYRLEAVRAGRL